jgi:hypothetical protein
MAGKDLTKALMITMFGIIALSGIPMYVALKANKEKANQTTELKNEYIIRERDLNGNGILEK